MSSALKIRLLGGFDAVQSDHSLTSSITPRLQALIAYLLLHRQAPVSRQQLAYLFWPDTTDVQARANLRHLLHSLRAILPLVENWIKFDHQTVQWKADCPFSLDVEEFEHASAQTDSISALQEAVQFYAGDLLPDCYEDWIAPERERLRQMFIDDLEKLVLLLENRLDYDSAIEFARLLLQHDPLQESTYRRLMRLHAIKGDRAGALRVYHTCVTILHRELNIEPGSKTQKAYRQLLNVDDQGTRSEDKVIRYIPLIGRKTEWAILQSVWRDNTVDRPRMILISGEAGIGKSRLAEEMVEWARRQGVQVARTNCFAAQSEFAYAPLATLLRGLKRLSLEDLWLSEVSRLLPELLIENPGLSPPQPIKEGWQRLRLFEALARALLGNPGAHLFLLEDLHLCDRDTLELLQYLLNLALARPDILAGRKLFLLGTLRVEEENSNIQLKELLSTLRGGEQFTEIQLAPLDETETKLLAAYISERELTSEEARNLHRETEGNPLFIVETIRAGISDRLPPKVQAVIKARLGQVSSLARELVDLAAVIGREFSFQMIAKASDQDEESLVKGLDELWQRHIIREQGSDSYDFSHDKIREVVYTSLSSARRRWFHRRVGNALEAVHQGALELVSGQIGNHFELAGMPGEAISYYRQAAETARNIYANREAVNFLRRCLVIIQSGDPSSVSSQETVVEIDESLGEILALVGEYSEAREVFHLALPYVNESDLIKKASLQTKIGNTFREQGTFEQAIHHYQTAESILAKAPENENPQWWQEWVQVKLERMLTHYWLGQPDSMQNLLEETRPAVERYGTEIQQANFYLTHHRMELHRERYRLSDQTVALQRMATRQIEAVGSTSEIAAHRFTLGFSLLWSGHLVDAEETLQSALKLAEKTGNRQLQTRCLNYLTTLYRMLGRNELVQEYAERNLAAAIETCLPEYAFSARANQSWLALKEGKIQEAETLAQDALTRLTQSKVKYVFNWLALFPLIDIRLKIHRIDQAIEFAREIVSPEQQRLPEELSAALEQSVADWEGDDPESAVEQLHGAVKLAEQFGYL